MLILVEKIFGIYYSDSDKYVNLMLSEEFRQLYDQNKSQAQFQLSINPSKYLGVMNSIISQFKYVHETALEARNKKISTLAVSNLNQALAKSLEIPENGLVVDELLRSHTNFMVKAIEYDDASMYSAAVRWYANIVLDSDNKMKLDYIQKVNSHLFSTLKYIINIQHDNIFEELVRSLIQGLFVLPNVNGIIWRFSNSIFKTDSKKYLRLKKEKNIRSKIKKLQEGIGNIDSVDDLKKWRGSFKDLCKLYDKYYDKIYINEVKDEADKIEKYAILHYKYNKLLYVVFIICAYTLYKKRYHLIKYLWEFKQPSDSSAINVVDNIYPESVEECIRFYFKKGGRPTELLFWEDHHSGEKYYNQYFILLLMYLIKTNEKGINEIFDNIKNTILPKLNIHRLGAVKYRIERLKPLIEEIRSNSELLRELPFKPSKIDELIDEKLLPLLDKIKEQSAEQIEIIKKKKQISANKVKEFKAEFSKEFNKRASFRRYFEDNGCIVDRLDQVPPKETKSISINKSIPKTAFFTDWHIDHPNLANNYGRTIAICENSLLFEWVKSQCKELDEQNIKVALESLSELKDIVLLAEYGTIFNRFFNSDKFISYLDTPPKSGEKNEFKGYYIYNNKEIPVYEFPLKDSSDEVMIFNQTQLGSLIQYMPSLEGDNKEFIEDRFYMEIRAYSEHTELLNNFIQNPPDWLDKKGNEKEQRECLKKLVLLKIYEVLEYKPNPNFEGYYFKISD